MNYQRYSRSRIFAIAFAVSTVLLMGLWIASVFAPFGWGHHADLKHWSYAISPHSGRLILQKQLGYEITNPRSGWHPNPPRMPTALHEIFGEFYFEQDSRYSTPSGKTLKGSTRLEVPFPVLILASLAATIVAKRRFQFRLSEWLGALTLMSFILAWYLYLQPKSDW